MKETALKLWRGDDVSFGTRILTFATSIRWIGWGFAESLIPIFIFSLAGGFAEAGLLRSSYEIALILSLPLIGALADRVKATTIILIGLSFYLFVGTGYLLAGVTGMAVWIVLARLLNGMGYAMDSIGREVYFRRHNHTDKIATVFGYFDTITSFWWSLAAVAGIVLVKYFELHWLLFLIVPLNVVAMAIIWAWMRPSDAAPTSVVVGADTAAQKRGIMNELIAWNWKLKLLVAFTFVLAVVSSTIAFYLPIEMYMEGSGYAPVILLGVIMTVPAFFGWVLGKIFDREGPRTFAYGLIAYAALVACLGFTGSYVVQIGIAFIIGFVQEFIGIGKEELVTAYADSEHFGRVGGIMRSIVNVGAMVGPLAAGILIDSSGTSVVYWLLALLLLALSVAFIVVRKVTHRHTSVI